MFQFNNNKPLIEPIEKQDRIQIKKNEVFKMLKEIVNEKNKNKKLFIKYRRRNNFLKTVCHGANAISVSSLITSVATVNPIGVIIGLIFGSCSSVGSAVNDSLSNLDKYLTTRTTFQQYSNLEREIRSVLLKNHLSSEDLDDLIEDTNHKISLIQDSSLF
jgi:hypothetical protein